MEDKKLHNSSKIKKIEEQKPLFTVALVTFCQRHLLEDCLDSIFNQDYDNIELIVCDDCSCDFDPDDVRNYIDENKSENIKNVVIFKHEHNVGTVKNCQKAFELSNGAYFKLQAGDDVFFGENVLSTIYREFQKKGKDGKPIKLIFSRAVGMTYDGQLTQNYYPPEDKFQLASCCDAEALFDLIGTCCWGAFVNAPAVFWCRELIEKMNGFPMDYKYTEDWPMWLKICESGELPHYFNVVTVKYRYGGISNSQPEQKRQIGKVHYYESARMLRTISYPHLMKKGNYWHALCALQAAKSLEERACAEIEWNSWGISEKIMWRLKNIPFYYITILIRAKLGAIRVPLKKMIGVDGILAMMLWTNINFFPAGKHPYVLSWLLLAALGCTVLLGTARIAVVFLSHMKIPLVWKFYMEEL